MKPRAVLAYCREKGVRFVDLLFPDGRGRSRRLTIPVNILTESSFEQGFGVTPGVGRTLGKSGRHLVAIPTPVQTYLDPLLGSSTLILHCTLTDGQTGEPLPLDPRELVKRAVESVRSVGLADGVFVQLSAPFSYVDEQVSYVDEQVSYVDEQGLKPTDSIDRWLGDGVLDRHHGIRCELAELCVEAGIGLERHYLGDLGVSEMQLVAKPLLSACDDLMVFRSLLEKHSLNKGLTLDPATSYSSTNLIFTKNSEPIVGGVYEFALSELAWYAAGGVIKHQLALAGIARATMRHTREKESKVDTFELGERLERCDGTLTQNDPSSLVSVHYASLDPRQRALRVRGVPSNGCPYTLLSAILLAMIDGILNKVAPVTVRSAESVDIFKGSNAKALAECLQKDCEFLSFCEVFPDTLVQALVDNLS